MKVKEVMTWPFDSRWHRSWPGTIRRLASCSAWAWAAPGEPCYLPFSAAAYLASSIRNNKARGRNACRFVWA